MINQEVKLFCIKNDKSRGEMILYKKKINQEVK